MGLVTGRLHFYRADLVAIGNQEIHLVIVLAAFRGKSIIVEFMACCLEHLCHHIFIHISQIRAQLVAEQLLINNIFREFLVPESKGNKQSGIANEHLVAAGVLMQGHACVWVVRMMSHAYHHGLLHFRDGFSQTVGTSPISGTPCKVAAGIPV